MSDKHKSRKSIELWADKVLALFEKKNISGNPPPQNCDNKDKIIRENTIWKNYQDK